MTKTDNPFRKWKKKNQKARKYAHFDKKIALPTALPYIQNAVAIQKHPFHPFLHFQIVQYRYKRDKVSGVKNRKEKKRDIYYSSHIDRYIFSYYGHLLNQLYNRRLLLEGCDDISLAYRDNKRGMSNIQYAKIAFDCIRKSDNCFVLIGDFKGFFDNLDHLYLKRQLISLLEQETLPADYYAVFKNITKFSHCHLKDILAYKQIKVKLTNQHSLKKAYHQLNELEQICSPEEFRVLKKSFKKVYNTSLIQKNCNSYGIPQGSAISGVLSNIYMMDFDKKMKSIFSDSNGLYMRYSDDFIVILPTADTELFKQKYQILKKVITDTDGLELEPDKTQIFKVHGENITRQDPENVTAVIDSDKRIHYLGFTFNGKKVSIRDKTISKYYYRLDRKVKRLNQQYQKGNVVTPRAVYESSLKNTIQPKGTKRSGNFISYAKRAGLEFGLVEDVHLVVQRHLPKIKKRIAVVKDQLKRRN